MLDFPISIPEPGLNHKLVKKGIPGWKIIVMVTVYTFLLSGCMQVALRLSPSLFPNFVSTIFEECDPELAKDAIPANLKLLEGLLKNDPDNRQILIALSLGYNGYSMFFIEEDNPERASDLYIRAKDYGIRALGDRGEILKNPEVNRESLQIALKKMGIKQLEPLFWATMAWNAWINLNLDKPAALAQLNLAQVSLERLIDIDPSYLHGLPYLLMGVSLGTRPKMFGGDVKQAKAYFEKALLLSSRKFFLVHYYFARTYAVRVQDKALFSHLLDEVIKGDPRELKDVCLINQVVQNKSSELKERAEELFY